MTTVFLRAQNSEFVLGTVIRDPKGLPGISKEDFDDQVTMYCFYYLGLGFAMFATSYIQIVCWETFAERIAHKLRQIYLKAILRQQISWFDAQQTGNLTARLTDDLERVREGLGDKLSLFIQMVSAFVAGFGVGFAYRSVYFYGLTPPPGRVFLFQLVDDASDDGRCAVHCLFG
ncbi:hypothetical protein TELCIR_14569 [Teladorsagia circumcincta]|uniref:ABC transmembrane type-1 domain-containing protein n=1 Tax=Teladorsagia circumcincta TaxID=45464 RepID=A0A2G9U0S6_TELCI|nr:hypothetical protein TELCIR_14569 [Teladorsagia circumcincta]